MFNSMFFSIYMSYSLSVSA